MRRKPKQSMRKQANRGRKDQRRGKKEEETHHERSVTVDRNSFYRKPENGHYRTFYRKFGERAAEGEIGRDFS